VSGGEKLIAPHQNFLYVIQSYQLLPDVLEKLTAIWFPWLELFTGIFLCLGLWLGQVLIAAGGMLATFLMVVSQAVIRRLPITECGCFGGLLAFPLHVVLVFDLGLLVVVAVLWRYRVRSACSSLDSYFAQQA